MGLVRPVLEFGTSVWDPQSIRLQDKLENLHSEKRSWFVPGSYTYETGSMTESLE